MNVLMNCLPLVSGGGIAIVRNLTPLLSRRFVASSEGHKLIFLAHEDQKELFSTVPDDQLALITGIGLRGWRRVLWERRNMERIVTQTGADLLFTPYQIGSLIKRVKQVFMLTNMEPFLFDQYEYDIKTRLRNHMLRRASIRCLESADRVIAISEFTQSHLIEALKIPSGRVRMVYHGRDVQVADRRHESADQLELEAYSIGDHFVLTSGSLLPYRRCEDVIAAFDRAVTFLPEEVQLVIAGSGTDKRYSDLIRRSIDASPYRQRIFALGHVPWDTMKALYRRCDLFVTATEIEACPNIAIEAMTAGCVIVSTNKPPLPEMFQDACIEYRARDTDNIVEQIDRSMSDDCLRRDMRSRARQRAESFSWERCAKETYTALIDWP